MDEIEAKWTKRLRYFSLAEIHIATLVEKKKPLLALLNGFNLRINTKNYFIRIHYLKKKTLSIFVENTKEIHVSVLKFGIETEVDKIL